MANGFYRNYGKRLFDLAIAIPALILLLPVLALTALAVRHLKLPFCCRPARRVRRIAEPVDYDRNAE